MDLDKISKLINDSGGVRHEEKTTTSGSEYGNMIVDEHPEDDEEDVIDKYLSTKLILGRGTSNKHYGRLANQ
eukprot:7845257-Ditylum_brightwellii.AAC.1